MGFIDSYKWLEKLCGEILDDDRRVSAYIDEMNNTPQGAHLVCGWDDDLKQLKHYRWIRNQIVHDPGCTEENMCSDYDTQWITNFYSRIMNQTDPLALYRKATQPRHIPTKKKTNSRHYQGKIESNHNTYKASKKGSGCGAVLLIAVATVAAVAILWLLLV
jgi:hypothetical protein